MSTLDYRATAILTEHLGYPPLTLIDHVINAVNHVLDNCIAALDKYLDEMRIEREKQVLKNRNSDNDVLVNSSLGKDNSDYIDLNKFLEEIISGSAKLETLLNSQIDKNFDKFELYTLRNILTIPKDLVEEGWIKLKHHEGVDFSIIHNDYNNESKKLDSQIKQLMRDISLELKLRKILKLQLIKANKILKSLEKFKEIFLTTFFDDESNQLTTESKIALRSLEPITDNLYFILNQVDELISQISLLNSKFLKNKTLNDINNLKFLPTIRDRYIWSKSTKLLESVGVLHPDNSNTSSSSNGDTTSSYNNTQFLSSSSSFTPSIINASRSDVDTVIKINDKIRHHH